jgi:hypothetical protein
MISKSAFISAVTLGLLAPSFGALGLTTEDDSNSPSTGLAQQGTPDLERRQS